MNTMIDSKTPVALDLFWALHEDGTRTLIRRDARAEPPRPDDWNEIQAWLAKGRSFNRVVSFERADPLSSEVLNRMRELHPCPGI